MANYNLTNQDIKDTFQQLAQVSGSIEGGVAGSGVTDGTGSRITNLHVTASNAISASHALTASYAENAGVSVDTGSLLVTASNVDATITYTKGDGSTFQNIINNVAFSTEAEDLVITVKNTSGGTLAKGTAVHAVSVTGENVDVIAASNDSAATMPAIGLLSAELTNNSAGTCIIAGRDKGLNTTGLVAGDSVYVHTGGALTSTKPTGSALIQNIGTAAKIDASDGEIIVQGSNRVNDLPNLTTDYVWKGDSNGVPQAVPVSGLAITSASYAVSASYALSASVEIIKEVSSSYADVAARVAYDQNVVGGGIYDIPFVKSVSAGYADLGDNSSYRLQLDNVAGEIIASGSNLVVGAGGGDLKVTGSSNIEIQAGDINFKDGNVSILTNGGNVLTNNGANTVVQGTTNVDIRDGGTIFMRTGQNAVGGIQLAGAQVKVLGDSSASSSLRVDGDIAGTGALALEVKSTITSQSVDIQGGTRFSGSLRSIGGQIQLGDTGSGNSIDIPESGTSVVKGSTDFVNGAFYFGDQINVGQALNLLGGGSSINVTDGTSVNYNADINVSSSKQLIGTASYAMFALSASYAPGGGGGAAFPFTGSAAISGTLAIDGETPNLSINQGNSGGTPNISMYNAYNGTDVKFSNFTINDSTGTYARPTLIGRFSNAVTAFGNAAGDPFTVIAGGADGGAFLHWGLVLDQTGDIKSLKQMNMYSGAIVSGSLVVTGSTDIDGVLSLPGIANVSASIVAAENVSTFPFTGSAVISGSLEVTGSADITGSLTANLEELSTSGLYAIPTISGSGSQKKFVDVKWAPRVDAALGTTNFGGVLNSPFAPAIQVTGSYDGTGGLTDNSLTARGGNIYIGQAAGGGTTPTRITAYGNYSGSTAQSNYLAFVDSSGTYPGPPPGTFGVYSIGGVAGSIAGQPYAIMAGGSIAGEKFHWGIMMDQTGDIKTLKKMSIRNSADVSGSLAISGSVNGNVIPLAISATTASMDFNNGNFFTLTLANGVDTHLDAANVTAGQTITLTVTNNATGAGTLSFSPDFKFAGGTAPTVTAATNAVDVLTFVTTDATSVYGTGLLNFS